MAMLVTLLLSVVSAQDTGIPALDAVLKENCSDTKQFNPIFALEVDPTKYSKKYTLCGLAQALKRMEVAAGGAKFFAILSGNEEISSDLQLIAAQINLAAFLAEARQETIYYDACDENNWRIPAMTQAASCGPADNPYADRSCESACEVDFEMKISATNTQAVLGAPPPLFCAPQRKTRPPITDFRRTEDTGGVKEEWDHNSRCVPTGEKFNETIPVWERRGCNFYEGQKQGAYTGRSNVNVAGCCWWARGVIQGRGTCFYGKLNRNLGIKADKGKQPYPNIDFCKNPGAICSEENPDLKWAVGLFRWLEIIAYEKGGWNYKEELQKFAIKIRDGEGAGTDNSFIDAASGILLNDDHTKSNVHRLDRRRQFFWENLKIFNDTFGDGSVPDVPVASVPDVPVTTVRPNDSPSVTVAPEEDSFPEWLLYLIIGGGVLLLLCCLVLLWFFCKSNKREAQAQNQPIVPQRVAPSPRHAPSPYGMMHAPSPAGRKDNNRRAPSKGRGKGRQGRAYE